MADTSSATAAAQAPSVEWNTTHLYVLSIVWVCIAAIVVTARIVTRLRIVKSPGVDDLFIVMALLSSIAVTATMIEQIRQGMGTAYPNNLKVALAFWVSVWTYGLTISLTKLAIVLSYLRIFPHERFRKTCWVVLVILVIHSLWSVLGSILICLPVHNAWTAPLSNQGCMNRTVAWIFNACFNVFSDLALIILPMPVLKNLNMRKRQKIALMFVFAIGGFVCVMSAIRLSYLVDFLTKNKENNSIALWSVIEINVGIICASLPALKALVTRAWPRFAGYSTRSKCHVDGCPNCRNGVCGTDNETILGTYSSEVDNKNRGNGSFALTKGIKSTKIFKGDNSHNTTTRVQGGRRFSMGHRSQHPDSSNPSGLGRSTAPNHHFGLFPSATKTVSNNTDSGIAVTTILEQEIEMMSRDGSSTHSVNDTESHKDLLRQDSGNNDFDMETDRDHAVSHT